MKRIALILAGALVSLAVFAQKDFGGVARFDKTVHDFGKVDIKDGAVSCRFTVTNISDEALNILVVTSSCSCTSAVWTREEIAPGKSGTIDVSFKNDEGPYPFDKALTVYLSSVQKPVVIHIKGTSYDGKKRKK